LRNSEKFALVLAFGRLSLLEACSLPGGLRKVELPCERVAVVETGGSSSRSLTGLAGIHKFAPLTAQFEDNEDSVKALANRIADAVDKVRHLALSGYDMPEADYEALVRMLLDAIRDVGFKKVKLLRPKGNELLAEQVSTRDALDIIAFPHGRGYGLGPTAWVADIASIRHRALAKPAPHSDISLSPRLAQLLVNLSGLSPGQVLLDPFCGSGTILAEGLWKSLVCIGLDSKPSRVRDAGKNLGWSKRNGGRGSFALGVGDARDLQEVMGYEKADGVVTEPLLLPRFDYTPNTQAASALLESAGDTYADALSSTARVLRRGARVVVVVPVLRTTQGGEVSITLDGASLGLKEYQPGPISFQYPVRLSFESTRWIKRAVYVFESRA
jgi:tRNA G10  N-methylase Trm11